MNVIDLLPNHPTAPQRERLKAFLPHLMAICVRVKSKLLAGSDNTLHRKTLERTYEALQQAGLVNTGVRSKQFPVTKCRAPGRLRFDHLRAMRECFLKKQPGRVVEPSVTLVRTRHLNKLTGQEGPPLWTMRNDHEPAHGRANASLRSNAFPVSATFFFGACGFFTYLSYQAR